MKLQRFLQDYCTKENVQDLLRRFDLPVSGNKNELVSRLMPENNPDFGETSVIAHGLYKEELQKICDRLDIPRSGTKEEIWERILYTTGLPEEVLPPELPDDQMLGPLSEDFLNDILRSDDDLYLLNIYIKEIKCPESIPSSSTSFPISMVLKNEGTSKERVQIWHNAVWPEAGSKTEPPFQLDLEEMHTENIYLPTPSIEGKYNLIIKLLDSSGRTLKSETQKLEFQVTKRRNDRILKWGKIVGKALLLTAATIV